MKKKISVILPTYNESKNILDMIRQLTEYLKPYDLEIIVSDDNSPDLTWKKVKQRKIPLVKVIRRMHDPGVAAAIFDGIKRSTGDIIVWMDADLSHPPSLLPKMLDSLAACDVAVASRYVDGGKDKRGFARVATSKFINGLANMILPYKVKDYTSGYIALRREVIKKVMFEPTGHGEYFIEFLHKAAKKGFRIKEIGYVFTERKCGKSKTNQGAYSMMKHGVRYFRRMLKARYN